MWKSWAFERYSIFASLKDFSQQNRHLLKATLGYEREQGK